LAKLLDARGKVLLLGASFETMTLLHYAEHMARLPKKRVIRYREPLLVNRAKSPRELMRCLGCPQRLRSPSAVMRVTAP
jgi:aminoglycoside N3'-acetyltransferase